MMNVFGNIHTSTYSYVIIHSRFKDRTDKRALSIRSYSRNRPVRAISVNDAESVGGDDDGEQQTNTVQLKATKSEIIS